MVKLCYFVGLTQAQAAREMNVSVATAERLWAFARAWLLGEIQKENAARWDLQRLAHPGPHSESL